MQTPMIVRVTSSSNPCGTKPSSTNAAIIARTITIVEILPANTFLVVSEDAIDLFIFLTCLPSSFFTTNRSSISISFIVSIDCS